MKPLAGQRVLLIGIGFYDYESAIAAELLSLGAEVRIEDERPPEMRGRLKTLRGQLRPTMTTAVARHHAAMLQRARANGPVDRVVVIKGAMLDEDFLCALRDALPSARFIAYHWDSMARYEHLIRRQRLFDRVLTFDHADAEAHPGFILRPLFFRPELTQPSPEAMPKLDISFVGWLHHNRLAQVEAIRTQAERLELSGFYYLSTGSWTRLKLELAGRARDVRSKPMAFNSYAAVVAASDVILDLPHPEQTGLTMRAIEAIGSGKKLITTSSSIKKYDFYRPENIFVIDSEAPYLDPDFLSSSKTAIPKEIIARYTLRSWVLEVCGMATFDGYITQQATV